MSKIAVVFESKYGQCEKIAEHIVDLAQRHGHVARALRASVATVAAVDEHDAVVIVAPVYFGHHSRTIARFVRSGLPALSKRPVAVVSVSNSAGSTSAVARASASRIAREFVDSSGLTPRLLTTVGGALEYPRYGFLVRLMMKRVARRSGGPLDTTRIHELTNWAALDDSLSPLFEELAPRTVRGLEGSGVHHIAALHSLAQAR